MARSALRDSLVRTWVALSYRGITPRNHVEARALMGANNFYAITAAVNVVWALYIMAHDNWSYLLPGVTHLAMVGVWVAMLVLNGRGYRRWKPTTALIVTIAQYVFLCSVFSRAAGFQFALVVIPPLTFVMFVPRHWPLRVGISALALTVGLVMYFDKSFTIPQVEVSALWAQRSGALMIVSVTVLLIALASFNDYYFNRERNRIEGLLDEARVAAQTDSLTHLLNRRGVAPLLTAASEEGEYCVALGDLDRFKRVNDALGHGAGDVVLAQVAATLGSSIGRQGSVARWGGEEFLMVMPGLSLDRAEKLVDQARVDLEKRFHEDGAALTISIGVVRAPQHAQLESVLRLADAKLYEAKASGRNMVVTGRLDD